MGIPHLAQLLQPYAISTVLGCKTEQCRSHRTDSGKSTRSIIIDGPALAYHVYYKIRTGKPQLLNAFDAIPTYTETSAAFLTYLEELESYGLVIDGIYFDGYLPSRKQETRLQRLESHRNELRKFKAEFPEGAPILPGVSRLAPVSVTASMLLDHPVRYHRGIPAAPFFVASVIETLLESEYAAVTDVVPGEADTFCAVAARKARGGALIFTNDSDLLIHDIGPEGRIAFFTQVRIATELRDKKHSKICDTIRVNCFRNLEIAQRLGVANCKRLAFEIKCNPSTTLQAAIQRAKQPPSDASALEEFLSEYDPEFSKLNAQYDRGLDWDRQIYGCLDPRVSELVLQTINETSIQAINIYLPTLIEDPDRASAWCSTAEDRAFTYSCLQYYSMASQGSKYSQATRSSNHGQTTKCQILPRLYCNGTNPDFHVPYNFEGSKEFQGRKPCAPYGKQPSKESSERRGARSWNIPTEPSTRPINEVFRKGDRIATKPIAWLSKSDTSEYARCLLHRFQRHQKNICESGITITPYSFWRSYAVSRATDSDMSTEAFLSVLKGEREASFWSWKDVQLAARIEAIIYSLRILHQVLRYLIMIGASLPEPMIGLDQALATLPPLKIMMATRLEVLQRGISGFQEFE